MRCGAVVAALLLSVSAVGAEKPSLKLALTFDDLPLNGPLPAGFKKSAFMRDTLAVFKRHRIGPTYGFINAGQLERDPDGALALKLWIAAGHPLANHSYSHMDLSTNSAEDFQRDVLRNEPALLLLTPEKPAAKDSWRWFRYPYLHEGDTLEKRHAVRGFLESGGYRIAQTTLDWEDYLWNDAYARCLVNKNTTDVAWLRESYLAAADRFLTVGLENSRRAFGRDISHVLLLHQGAFSATILPDMFALLKKRGFEIVTLEEAQRDPAYESDPDLPLKWGGTLTDQVLEAKKLPYPTVEDKPREQLKKVCS